jgi:hypothetical protein
MDTEDKTAWCNHGAVKEVDFANSRLFDIGLAGHINLAKKNDPYTHDLFVQFPVDLKSVTTPLFKAQDLYGLDPQYTVTFNHKDAVRYKEKYPNILVLFDINWETLEKDIGGHVYHVDPMHVTVAGFLSDISRAIKKSGMHKIEYKNRVNDDAGNAKVSWVFDLRLLHPLRSNT